MKHYYFLSAYGPDRGGLVAQLTKILYRHKANIEDSSMMRLGAEFGIFLIFTADIKNPALNKDLAALSKKLRLFVNLKEISKKEAQTSISLKPAFMVTAHGKDQPGLVYKVTEALAAVGFNISDLETHRTDYENIPGYILFIEGNLPPKTKLSKIKNELSVIGRHYGLSISIRPLAALTPL